MRTSSTSTRSRSACRWSSAGPAFQRGSGAVRRSPTSTSHPRSSTTPASTPALRLDGRSLSRLISSPRFEPGRAIVLENWCGNSEACFAATTPRYRAVRTQRYVYAEYPNGEKELYDLAADPFQLTSLHGDPGYADRRRVLAELLGGAVRLRRRRLSREAGAQVAAALRAGREARPDVRPFTGDRADHRRRPGGRPGGRVLPRLAPRCRPRRRCGCESSGDSCGTGEAPG